MNDTRLDQPNKGGSRSKHCQGKARDKPQCKHVSKFHVWPILAIKKRPDEANGSPSGVRNISVTAAFNGWQSSSFPEQSRASIKFTGCRTTEWCTFKDLHWSACLDMQSPMGDQIPVEICREMLSRVAHVWIYRVTGKHMYTRNT